MYCYGQSEPVFYVFFSYFRNTKLVILTEYSKFVDVGPPVGKPYRTVIIATIHQGRSPSRFHTSEKLLIFIKTGLANGAGANSSKAVFVKC